MKAMMSNFSDPATALLTGMAAEWRLLAVDIARLAETACSAPSLNTEMLVKLQAFDALLQNIEAQARLLQALAQDGDPASLAPLLDAHPLPGVRERLRASLGLEPRPPADDGALHLFTSEP
jgi:hypothetical protein